MYIAKCLRLSPGSTAMQSLRGTSLPVPQMIQIILEVANGMAHLHINRIVHGNLTTANCLTKVDIDGHVWVEVSHLSCGQQAGATK